MADVLPQNKKCCLDLVFLQKRQNARSHLRVRTVIKRQGATATRPSHDLAEYLGPRVKRSPGRQPSTGHRRQYDLRCIHTGIVKPFR